MYYIYFIIIILLIIIVVLVWYSWKGHPKNSSKQFKPIPIWHPDHPIVTYYLINQENGTRVFKLSPNQDVSIMIPDLEDYYEFNIINDQTKMVLHTLPYLKSLHIKIGQAVPPGDYILAINTIKEQNFPINNSIIILNQPEKEHINILKPSSSIPDDQYYDDLGDLHIKYSTKLIRKGYKFSYASASDYKDCLVSKMIRSESYHVNLESNQVCLVIVPSRFVTMGSTVVDIVMINGVNLEVSKEDKFNVYKLDGKQSQKYSIVEYLIGCNITHRILPFYVYV